MQVVNRSSFDNVFGATRNVITKGISCPFSTRRGGFSIKSSFEVSLFDMEISAVCENKKDIRCGWCSHLQKTCSNRDLHQLYEPNEFRTLVLHRFMCDEPTTKCDAKNCKHDGVTPHGINSFGTHRCEKHLLSGVSVVNC